MIVVTDVGQHQMWTGQTYKVDKPGTFITSGGLGTMGYGLPAAIGAKIANPKRNVLLITGDGSIQMSLAEIATAVQEELNIKILLFNNNTLGMVRELQQHNCGGRYFSVKMKGNPDFIKLADAYGIRSIRIKEHEEIEDAIKIIINSNEMILVEFLIDPDENVIPFKAGDKV